MVSHPISLIISDFKMRKVIVLSILLVLFTSCVDEYDLNLDESDSKLVVEGLITNQKGPYYIRLTESHSGKFIEPTHSPIDSAKGIMNALIIISDNINQIDTLLPINVNPDEYEYDYRFGYYKYLHDNNGNVIDTLWLTDPIEFRHDRGYYKTKHLVGIPGRTYFLKVVSGGKEYEASEYMPSVPVIDSLGYSKKVSEKDGQEYYVPLLYFAEPQAIVNYYLIQLKDEILSRRYAEDFNWEFSILSDEFLQPYVNGLNVSLGENPRGFEYPIYMEGDSIYVALSSLTKNAYEFYKAILQQFKNDGGAYQLAPSSPPTNISNGGLGYFQASSISEKRVKILKSN
jgi:hypothetical protein